MNRKLYEYIETEIPVLKKYPKLLRFIMLKRVRKFQPSYDAVYMFRYCTLFYKTRNLIKKQICRRYKRLLVYRYGIFFSVTEKTFFGKGISFPHPSSIVIGADVSVGENCVIYQNVTIGGARRGAERTNKYPDIGDNCILYAGSKILGGISLANGTKVGANAVLLRDTEEDSTYAGVPAKRIN